ncbi:O-antigen ligase family protein [Rheinheimera texasensis]|uniref:O-antigen ligase family protein n=1 Tax=Rheinheimera texasensis TaxID=306205 RepID=UPI0032B2CAC9
MFSKSFAGLSLVLYAAVFLAGTLFASTIARITEVGSLFDFKRLLVISVIACSAFILSSARQLRSTTLSAESVVALLIFFSVGFISALASAQPYWGFVELANIGLLVLAFFICSICCSTLSKPSVFRALYWFTVLFSLILLLQFSLKLTQHLLNATKPGIFSLISGFDNPRVLNQLQVMLLPLLLLPFLLSPLRQFQLVSMLLMAGHRMVLLQTEARGACLSLLLAFGLINWFSTPAVRTVLLRAFFRAMMLGLVCWAVFIIVLPYWMIGDTNLRLRTGSSGRTELWLYTLNRIPDQFWLGHGPMSFAWADGKPLSNTHPHNASLQILYEYGFLGFVTLLCWVCYSLVATLRKLQHGLVSPAAQAR